MEVAKSTIIILGHFFQLPFHAMRFWFPTAVDDGGEAGAAGAGRVKGACEGHEGERKEGEEEVGRRGRSQEDQEIRGADQRASQGVGTP